MSGVAAQRDKAIELSKQACAQDRAGNYEEALGLYRLALEHFMYVIKYETNPSIKENMKKRFEEYMIRAEQIQKWMKEKDQPRKVPAATTSGGGAASEDGEESKKLAGQIASAIVTEKPNVQWSDVAGLDAAKESLQEAVILPTKFPELFVGKRTPWKGILLYGPPGTGKTHLAKACATEAEATFFSISSSSLVSKYMGESERLVRELFTMARENTPAIIFIDEIDSLCSSRSEGENDATRRIKTEFLVQMQGVGNKDEGVLVLGATNVPWELDPAVRRRFEKRIYIPLPEAPARTTMFKLHVGTTPCDLNEQDYVQLGEMTEGLSGSDIGVVTREALYEPLRKCHQAVKFVKHKVGGVDKYAPCSPSDPNGIELRLMDVPQGCLLPPDVIKEDFYHVMEDKAKASVSHQDLQRQEEFTKEFGQEGS